MIPVNLPGAGFAIYIVLLFIFCVFLVFLLLSKNFRGLVKRNKILTIILLSPALYAVFMFFYYRFSVVYTYYYNKNLARELAEYKEKYTTPLEHNEKVMGVTFPKGTVFTGWHISLGTIGFKKAVSPTPFIYENYKILSLSPGRRTIEFSGKQEIDGFICDNNVNFRYETYIEKRREKRVAGSPLKLKSCHLAENPIKGFVAFGEYKGSSGSVGKIDRAYFKPSIYRPTAWHIKSHGKIADSEFSQITFTLDSSRNIIKIKGILVTEDKEMITTLSTVADKNEFLQPIDILNEEKHIKTVKLPHAKAFALNRQNATLAYAIVNRSDSLIDQLIEDGIHLEAPILHEHHENSQRTPLQLLLNQSPTSTVNSKRIIKIIAQIDKCDHTALILAMRNYKDLIGEVLKCGAESINQKDVDGSTVLTSAVRYHSIDVIKLLLKHGADPDNISNHGSTVLDDAKRRGDKEILKLLTDLKDTPIL